MALGFASGSAWALTANQAAPNPPRSGYSRETPASLSCIYQLVPTIAGCDPNNAGISQNTSLGSKVIVVVGLYHYPTLGADLTAYSSQFGLAAPTLNVVTAANPFYGTCSDAPQNSDIYSAFTCYQYGTNVLEVAHAMAPQAALVYVEVNGTTTTAVQQAVTTATAQAKSAGGGEVVLILPFAESSGGFLESNLQPSAANSNVLYFASAGYAGYLFYPGTSPNVVAVSASDIARDMENPNNIGQFLSERVSRASGGGLTTLFAAPAYQNRIASRIGNANKRAVPDIATASNGNNNIWVYNQSGWYSASGPFMPSGIAAGIANAANASSYFTSTTNLLTSMYAKMNTPAFNDVGVGICGASDGAFATVSDRNSVLNQWDFCSGLGAPRGITGFKP